MESDPEGLRHEKESTQHTGSCGLCYVKSESISVLCQRMPHTVWKGQKQQSMCCFNYSCFQLISKHIPRVEKAVEHRFGSINIQPAHMHDYNAAVIALAKYVVLKQVTYKNKVWKGKVACLYIIFTVIVQIIAHWHQ